MTEFSTEKMKSWVRLHIYITKDDFYSKYKCTVKSYLHLRNQQRNPKTGWTWLIDINIEEWFGRWIFKVNKKAWCGFITIWDGFSWCFDCWCLTMNLNWKFWLAWQMMRYLKISDCKLFSLGVKITRHLAWNCNRRWIEIQRKKNSSPVYY